MPWNRNFPTALVILIEIILTLIDIRWIRWIDEKKNSENATSDKNNIIFLFLAFRCIYIYTHITETFMDYLVKVAISKGISA